MANKESTRDYPKPYLEIGNRTANELEKIYKEWDYQYKPEYEFFFTVVMDVACYKSDFVEYMQQIRFRAYYSPHHTESDYNFNVLACLIYISVIEKIETPFDHVINSDKDFEWKLNNLFEKKK